MTSSLCNFYDAIYCINMSSRTDRWHKCIKQFEKFGITKNVKHVNAVQLESLEYPRKKLARAGCALSHMCCIENALANNYDKILILEDDWEPRYKPSEFEYAISIAHKELPDDWDLLYYGGNVVDAIRPQPLDRLSDNIWQVVGCASTHAIAYNRKIIKYMCNLGLSEQNISQWIDAHQAIDVYFINVVQTLFKSLIIGSLPILQAEDFSDIENTKVCYKSMMIERFRFFSEKINR